MFITNFDCILNDKSKCLFSFTRSISTAAYILKKLNACLLKAYYYSVSMLNL